MQSALLERSDYAIKKKRPNTWQTTMNNYDVARSSLVMTITISPSIDNIPFFRMTTSVCGVTNKKTLSNKAENDSTIAGLSTFHRSFLPRIGIR